MSWLTLIGRRRNDVALARVRADLSLIASRIDQQQPGRTTSLIVEPAAALSLPPARRTVLRGASIVLVAFGLVLLLAIWRIIISQMASAIPAKKKSARLRRPRLAKKAAPRKVAARPITGLEDPGWKRFVDFLETGSVGANRYVVLLGLDTFDSPQLLRSVEHGLPYSTFEQLLSNTSLATDEASALVDIPVRTLTRRKSEGRFHQDESDRLLRVARIFARALSLFEGDRDAAKHWLSLPQKALGGQVALTIARTEVGALEVERLIGRLEHGVFT